MLPIRSQCAHLMDKLQRDAPLRHVAQAREHPILNHRPNRKIEPLTLKPMASTSQAFRTGRIGTTHNHQIKGRTALLLLLSKRQGKEIKRRCERAEFLWLC